MEQPDQGHSADIAVLAGRQTRLRSVATTAAGITARPVPAEVRTVSAIAPAACRGET
ncbi:MAG: hypothetical protein OXN84_00700 [Albidovulum sp.]|nr:hypothetical protein [Albidovulum sp.]MDE0532010.1 hypothetical protein [Albidovulum sp.]